MKITNFVFKMNSCGINLRDFKFYTSSKGGSSRANGAFSIDVNDNGKFFVAKGGPKKTMDVIAEFDDEEEAVNFFFKLLFKKMVDERYLNESITKEVMFAEKSIVREFIAQEYGIFLSGEKQDSANWQQIMNDYYEPVLKNLRVLNEFKYYALNEQFVNDRDCVKVEGITAQMIYESTGGYSTVSNAFTQLCSLINNPQIAPQFKQALLDLDN